MKTNKLILNMNYNEKFKKKLALKFMAYNDHWMEELVEEWINDGCNNFIKESSHKEILEKLNEINYVLYFTFYQQIEKWTSRISNNKELAEDIIRHNFNTNSFKITEIKDGIVEVIFSEPIENRDYSYLNYSSESSINDILKEIDNWKTDVEIALGKDIDGYGIDEDTYTINLKSDYTFEYEFTCEFFAKARGE